jgi:hypothetical protein
MTEFTDEVPRRRKRPFLRGALLGFVLGAAVASGVFGLVLHEMQQRHRAELAAVGIKIDPAGLLEAALGKSDPNRSRVTSGADESKILEIGKAFVADLEYHRFVSAYRSTTAAYQMQTPRKMFDEMIEKFPGIRRMNEAVVRDCKVRKGSDGKGYEFYCTAKDNQDLSLINFSLVLLQENGDWKVNELEITAEKKP